MFLCPLLLLLLLFCYTSFVKVKITFWHFIFWLWIWSFIAIIIQLNCICIAQVHHKSRLKVICKENANNQKILMRHSAVVGRKNSLLAGREHPAEWGSKIHYVNMQLFLMNLFCYVNFFHCQSNDAFEFICRVNKLVAALAVLFYSTFCFYSYFCCNYDCILEFIPFIFKDLINSFQFKCIIKQFKLCSKQ